MKKNNKTFFFILHDIKISFTYFNIYSELFFHYFVFSNSFSTKFIYKNPFNFPFCRQNFNFTSKFILFMQIKLIMWIMEVYWQYCVRCFAKPKFTLRFTHRYRKKLCFTTNWQHYEHIEKLITRGGNKFTSTYEYTHFFAIIFSYVYEKC